MDEADIRLSIKHALEDRGWICERYRDGTTCPVCKTEIVPKSRGKPDLQCFHIQRPLVFVEAKKLKIEQSLAFSFNEISDYQRHWYSEFGKRIKQIRDADNDTMYPNWISRWIALGIIEKQKTRETCSLMYLIPWHEWRIAEQLCIDAGRLSIPFDLSLYKKREKAPTDIVTYFNKWQVVRSTHTKLFDDHPLAQGLASIGSWDFEEMKK